MGYERYSGGMAVNKGVFVRIPDELWDWIDEWRRAQPDIPTRPEAVRRLVEMARASLHEPRS